MAALRQDGRTDVTTVSINGSPQGVQLVKDGDMTATVWQPAFAEGEAVFQAILDSIAAGEFLEAQDHRDPRYRRDQGQRRQVHGGPPCQ